MEFLSLFQGVKKGNDGNFSAICPAHEDKMQSLSMKEEGGKIILNCFAGCTCKQICQAAGIKESDLFAQKQDFSEGLTVAALATDKKIPEEFLRAIGLVDMNREQIYSSFGKIGIGGANSAVHIPYWDISGNPSRRQRIRYDKKAKEALKILREGSETGIVIDSKEGERRIFLNKKHPYIQEQEKKIAFRQDFSVCSYDDEKAFLRGKIDFCRSFINKDAMMKDLEESGNEELEIENFVERVELTDWKTGKKAPASGKKQLYLYAIYFFQVYKNLESLEGVLFYVDEKDEKQREIFIITRKKAEREKEKILEKITTIEKTIETNSFKVCVTPLCAWCGFQEICVQENNIPKIEKGQE